MQIAGVGHWMSHGVGWWSGIEHGMRRGDWPTRKEGAQMALAARLRDPKRRADWREGYGQRKTPRGNLGVRGGRKEWPTY